MNTLKAIAARLGASDALFARKTYGGIRPQLHKQHSLRSRIMPTPIPEQLAVPVGDTEDGALELFVQVGDKVQKFQKLALFAPAIDSLHALPTFAPTSGTVTDISTTFVADHRNQTQTCIGIQTDGKDTQVVLDARPEPLNIASSELLTLIAEAGIVGMGGAGFPAAQKLASSSSTGIDLLIINAAECEPYITADEALIRERAENVLQGAEILKRACSARTCVLAIEATKTDAIDALTIALEQLGDSQSTIEIITVSERYPAGWEKGLIHSLTGIEIRSGEHPTTQGIVVQNAGTAYAAYRALVLGEPCVSRVTTLCGETLKTPKNFDTLIGTSAAFLFALCGIDPDQKSRSIVGGSIMGRELEEDSAVVCRTTNCLIGASASELMKESQEQACIRCGFCAQACPVRLLPQQLLSYSRTKDDEALIEHGLRDCIECGACDYVCPSHIPLASSFKNAKQKIRARAESLTRSEHWQSRFQQHQFRMLKEKEETQISKRKKPAARKESLSEEPSSEEFFSKEKASREIAAAVARVKARRKNASSSDEKN